MPICASILPMQNATRVEVRRGKNESATSLIRRFSRRAQSLGVVKEMRGRRYHEREKSKNVDHKRALVNLAKRVKYHELVKLGKIDPSARRGKRK
jgi:ribosomal protein S21